MTTTDVRATRNQLMAARRRKRRKLANAYGISLSYIDAPEVREHSLALERIGWTGQGIIIASRCTGTLQGLRLIQHGNQPTAHPKWRAVLQMPISLRVPDHVPDLVRVPALGAQRRIRALMALGYRHSDLTDALGGSEVSYRIAAGRSPLITAHTWRAIDDAFQRLSATPGPSERSRKAALAQGYAPPLAWDDIDNPHERPRGIRRTDAA